MKWQGVLIAFFILILVVIYVLFHPSPISPNYLAEPVYNGDKWKEMVSDVFTEDLTGAAASVKETGDISANK